MQLSALHLIFHHDFVVLNLHFPIELLPIGAFVESSNIFLDELLIEIRILDVLYYMVPVIYL